MSDLFVMSDTLSMTVLYFILSLATSKVRSLVVVNSHKYRSKELELKRLKVCFVTTAIYSFIVFICSITLTPPTSPYSIPPTIEYSSVIESIALIILLIKTRLIANNYEREIRNEIIKDAKEKEIQEYNRKRKENTDTTSEENITPGKRRTTAQLKQGAFELDERVRKKLEQQAEKHGTMKKGENPSRDVTIPDNVSIGKDGLPYIKTREFGYGKRFNAFITKNSDCYHRSKCPTIRFRKKTVMHRYTAMKIYKPCARCKPIDYIDNWYQVYLKQKK